MSLESKKEWVLPKPIDIKKIKGPLSPYLLSILKGRGVSAKDAARFLSTNIEDLPSVGQLFGTQKAAKQIIKAAQEGNKIFIHGDFDCDGVCASAIMWNFLYRELPMLIDKPVEVLPYIPSRVDEGYGLSNSSVDAMLEAGAQLIITVDCGIRDRELIEQYMDSNDVEFIITDHHQPPDDVWSAKYTIVHQLAPEKTFPQREICGSVIALYLTQAIRHELGGEDKISQNTPGLEFAALASVTDMMPIVSANRVIVANGLEQMRNSSNIGLNALMKSASVNPSLLDAYNLGFTLGPRINAAGRIGSAMDALRLLLTENPAVAAKLANQLTSLNIERQQITERILNEAKAQVEKQTENKLLFVHGNDWPEGIVGLVAGKLLELYSKPIIVATTNHGETRGSARSLKGFNVTEAIEKFASSLEKYGGHELAAGFTVKPGQLEQFQKELIAHANELIDSDQLIPTLEIDMLICSQDISIELCESLDQLKPFGYGNKKPVLMISSAVVIQSKPMGVGNKHMKVTFKDDGIGSTAAVFFNCGDDVSKIKPNDMIDLAGSISINEWNGNTDVQFIVSQWRRAV